MLWTGVMFLLTWATGGLDGVMQCQTFGGKWHKSIPNELQLISVVRRCATMLVSRLQSCKDLSWQTTMPQPEMRRNLQRVLPAGYTSSLQSNPPTSKYLLYRQRVVRFSLVENCSILHLQTALYFSLRSIVTPLSQSSPLGSDLVEMDVAACNSTMLSGPNSPQSLSNNLKADIWG